MKFEPLLVNIWPRSLSLPFFLHRQTLAQTPENEIIAVGYGYVVMKLFAGKSEKSCGDNNKK